MHYIIQGKNKAGEFIYFIYLKNDKSCSSLGIIQILCHHFGGGEGVMRNL